jgi:hypothetical protein
MSSHNYLPSSGIWCPHNRFDCPNHNSRVLEQLLASSRHGLVDLLAEFLLQPIERGVDLFWGVATLVELGDAFLEVHGRLDRA